MPNLVDNRLVVRGKASDLTRFLGNHLRATARADGGPEFDFDSVIPVPAPHCFEARLAAWDTKWNASETVVRWDGNGEVEVNFVTPWAMPEPIYRRLGRLYPELSFHIEAIDPDSWAMEGRVDGDDAEFRECEDFDAVFERFFAIIVEDADPGEAPQSTGASGSGIEFRIIERKY